MSSAQRGDGDGDALMSQTEPAPNPPASQNGFRSGTLVVSRAPPPTHAASPSSPPVRPPSPTPAEAATTTIEVKRELIEDGPIALLYPTSSISTSDSQSQDWDGYVEGDGFNLDIHDLMTQKPYPPNLEDEIEDWSS